ncbi:hypothetical protein [Bosea vaviloviae]|uniref:Uncharacterized protein n=1 Tax=Bosea vaviloviae TaxID=1526658 RepID=A0A0N0MBB1_9HYPH|nr:hypothetical protein [Bosea vaviloviae]KPH80686.1 hypothetical protein AE618_13190 [Bosea vaviloviae]
MSHTVMPVISPEAYLSEAAVEDRWRFLKAGELRRARKSGRIAFYAFPTGPHYTAEAVQEYLDRSYHRSAAWPNVSTGQPSNQAAPSDGNSAVTTSMFLTPIAEVSTTPVAMTPELALSAAEACVQRMARKRSKPSSPSSQPRPLAPRASAQALRKS